MLRAAGFSFATGQASTDTDGTSTTATVKVKLEPKQDSCAIITLVTRKVSAEGTVGAWVCATGYVGTHQNHAQRWKDVDKQGEDHSYRIFSLPCELPRPSGAGLLCAQSRACSVAMLFAGPATGMLCKP